VLCPIAGYIFANAGFSNLGLKGDWGNLSKIVGNVRKDLDDARPNWMGYVAIENPKPNGEWGHRQPKT
jgi:hypothetical protein